MSYLLISEAQAKFPLVAAGGQRDFKAWAKRILYREERGDKTLLLEQVRSAKMAIHDPPMK